MILKNTIDRHNNKPRNSEKKSELIIINKRLKNYIFSQKIVTVRNDNDTKREIIKQRELGWTLVVLRCVYRLFCLLMLTMCYPFHQVFVKRENCVLLAAGDKHWLQFLLVQMQTRKQLKFGPVSNYAA